VYRLRRFPLASVYFTSASVCCLGFGLGFFLVIRGSGYLTTWSAEKDALAIDDDGAPESAPTSFGAVISAAKATRAITVRIVRTTVI
jgi:hypothetical protein